MMNNKTVLALPVLGLLCGVCPAAEPVELKTENDKTNYSVGYQLGGDFKRQEVEIKPDMLLQGIEDAISGGEPLLDEQERRATLTALAQRVKAAQQEKLQQQGADNLKTGEAFLAENSGKEAVTTLASGLQYKVITAGAGKRPQKSDKVTVNYRGRLIDGTEFDSSYSRNEPATFGVGQVIPGWTEALQLMQEGDKWEIYIPSKLAYGERGAGARIPPNSTLIFEVELLSVAGAQAADTAKPDAGGTAGQ
jgi:FKBP-type peptidyl-prolyl cis-trans isomerase FklB